MLPYKLDSFNGFNQFSYDAIINTIQLYLVACPKCATVGTLIFYGHYLRSFFFDGDIIKLHAQRVFCKTCRTTHVILPSFCVPGSRYTIHDLIQISDPSSNEDDLIYRLQVSLDTIRRIRSQFRLFWSHLFPVDWLDRSISDLRSFVFSRFARFPFQLRILYLCPPIPI